MGRPHACDPRGVPWRPRAAPGFGCRAPLRCGPHSPREGLGHAAVRQPHLRVACGHQVLCKRSIGPQQSATCDSGERRAQWGRFQGRDATHSRALHRGTGAVGSRCDLGQLTPHAASGRPAVALAVLRARSGGLERPAVSAGSTGGPCFSARPGYAGHRLNDATAVAGRSAHAAVPVAPLGVDAELSCRRDHSRSGLDHSTSTRGKPAAASAPFVPEARSVRCR